MDKLPGADDDGEHFVGDLADSGVSFHTASPEEGVSGKCLVMVTENAERTMNSYLGASEQLTGREIDEAALLESEWLYIEELRKYRPDIAEICEISMSNAESDLDFSRVSSEKCSLCPSESIDYAVMEKNSRRGDDSNGCRLE